MVDQLAGSVPGAGASLKVQSVNMCFSCTILFISMIQGTVFFTLQYRKIVIKLAIRCSLPSHLSGCCLKVKGWSVLRGLTSQTATTLKGTQGTSVRAANYLKA